MPKTIGDVNRLSNSVLEREQVPVSFTTQNLEEAFRHLDKKQREQYNLIRECKTYKEAGEVLKVTPSRIGHLVHKIEMKVVRYVVALYKFKEKGEKPSIDLLCLSSGATKMLVRLSVLTVDGVPEAQKLLDAPSATYEKVKEVMEKYNRFCEEFNTGKPMAFDTNRYDKVQSLFEEGYAILCNTEEQLKYTLNVLHLKGYKLRTGRSLKQVSVETPVYLYKKDDFNVYDTNKEKDVVSLTYDKIDGKKIYNDKSASRTS